MQVVNKKKKKTLFCVLFSFWWVSEEYHSKVLLWIMSHNHYLLFFFFFDLLMQPYVKSHQTETACNVKLQERRTNPQTLCLWANIQFVCVRFCVNKHVCLCFHRQDVNLRFPLYPFLLLLLLYLSLVFLHHRRNHISMCKQDMVEEKTMTIICSAVEWTILTVCLIRLCSSIAIPESNPTTIRTT